MKIPKEIIDEIKRRADIVDVIGDYVALKPGGRNWKGLCPFHNEKTPSFTVSRNDGFYYCFGCKETGNVFHFIQKHLNFSFYEAIKFLGERYNVELSSEYQEQENTLEQIIYKLYNIAKEFYTEKLFSIGINASEYFQSRHLSDEMIVKFGLGYAPNSFDSLLKHLILTQYEKDIMLESGLIKEKNGKHYDFFRDRAMFPIRDYIGRTLAFGGRTLNHLEKEFKYINSADSLIYDKKQTLFGLYEAKNEIRKLDAAIIVEGYIDVISLYQAGVKNVVAPCGTALSKEQLFGLKKHTNPKKLYLMFDGDTAGQAASIRAIQPALEAGFDLNIITLPQGKDPDSIINEENGIEELENYIKQSTNFIEYMYGERRRQNKINSPAEKVAAIRNFIRHILFIPDKLEHNFHIETIKEIFDISMPELRNIYSQLAETATYKTAQQPRYTPITAEPDDIDWQIESEEAEEKQKELLPTERQVIYFALMQNANIELLRERNVTEDSFVTPQAKDIFYFMEQYFDAEDTFQSMLAAPDISDGLKRIIAGIKAGLGKEESKLWKDFTDSESMANIKTELDIPLHRLRIAQINAELEEITPKLASNIASIEGKNLLRAKYNGLLQERAERHKLIEK